ncbi:MAG: hypothetical protein HUJ66_03145 [Oscillospiraceae bacterium]|nr:hypothetical protein [Oscillospiraceae bacterium]
MKKFVVPAVLAVGAAAAVLVLGKKKPAEGGKKGSAPAAGKKPVMKEPKTTVYSFVSGYQNPVTVEVSMKYDAQKVDLAVIEENFMVATSNPQVVTALAGQFCLQLEAANFYSGETFESMCAEAAEKFTGCGEVSYGELKGIKYNAGDGVNFRFPVDEASYLLVSSFKGPDNDDDAELLFENAELGFFLENITIEKKA